MLTKNNGDLKKLPFSKKVGLGSRLYGIVVEDAMAYFTQHNTVIHING